MTRRFARLTEPDLSWQNTAPVSEAFGDIYFNPEAGQDESRFVFLDGCDFEAEVRARPHTVIGETGFGTGLNFLNAWQRWVACGRPGRLTFLSTEAYPLRRSDLARAHAAFPGLRPYAEALQHAYPPPARGFHPRVFEDGKLRLVLLLGDAATTLGDLDARVDLWFLDGFAPAKNPELWSDRLFDQVARLSRPGTRIATFTAAGFVRRALAERGFNVRKAPGFGRKRERLLANMVSPLPAQDPGIRHPWLPEPRAALPGSRILVIGGGLAGRLTAQGLIHRDMKVDLADDPDSGTASRVPAALLAPRFLLDDQPVADFLGASYAFAVSHPALRPFFIAPRGLRLIARDSRDRERQAQILKTLNWGEDWFQEIEGGLRLPNSGTVDTHAALSALPRPTAGPVTTLQRHESGWFAEFADETSRRGPYGAVVIAAGQASAALTPGDAFTLEPRGGYTFAYAANTLADAPPETLSAQAGLSPANHSLRHAGASFARGAPGDADTAEVEVRAKLAALDIHPAQPPAGHWSGVRATTPDRLPLCGALPDLTDFKRHIQPYATDARQTLNGPPPDHTGLYVLTGLGSKAWQHVPLLADALAAQIAGEPVALPVPLQQALSPLRFMVRSIRRGHRP